MSQEQLGEEERKRIYSEEKARQEARDQIQRERQQTYEEERARVQGAGEAGAALAERESRIIHSGSWGATFGPIYLAAMQSWGHAALALLLGLIPLVNIAVFIYYIVRGKQIAWTHRTWRSFDDFLACQRVWDTWAKWFLAISIALGILAAIVSSTGSSTSI